MTTTELRLLLSTTLSATTRQLRPSVPRTWKGFCCRSAASAAVMLVMSGWTFLVPAERHRRLPRREEHQRVVRGDALVLVLQLAEGLLLAHRGDRGPQFVVDLPLQIAVQQGQGPGAGGGEGHQHQCGHDGDKLRPQRRRLPTVQQQGQRFSAVRST